MSIFLSKSYSHSAAVGRTMNHWGEHTVAIVIFPGTTLWNDSNRFFSQHPQACAVSCLHSERKMQKLQYIASLHEVVWCPCSSQWFITLFKAAVWLCDLSVMFFWFGLWLQDMRYLVSAWQTIHYLLLDITWGRYVDNKKNKKYTILYKFNLGPMLHFENHCRIR